MVAVDVVLRAPGDASARGGRGAARRRPARRRGLGRLRRDGGLAGRGERPTLTPHALDGLSFPVTLAWAMQQPRVADAIRDARRGATARTCAPPRAPRWRRPRLSATRTRTRRRSPCSSRALRAHGAVFAGAHRVLVGGGDGVAAGGGVHLAFVGPDVDVSTTSSRATSFCRLAPNLTASARSETAGAYLSRLSPGAPCMVMGSTRAWAAAGRARARVASDLVAALKRPNTPAAFTCANAFADLAGELGVFRALGARSR